MDRLINNEGIVICSVVSAMNLDVNEISKLYLFAVLTSDRAIRKRLPNYNTYEEMVVKESAYYQALNRKFLEFQPVFMNAMTMLEMGGKIENIAPHQYDLTQEGNLMALDLQKSSKDMKEEVLQVAIHLHDLLGKRETKQLYKDFKIVL